MRHTLLLIATVVNVALAVLGWLAFDYGLIQTAWANDTTYITTGMVSVFGLTYLLMVRDIVLYRAGNLALYEWLAALMPLLGMTGTVYGFYIALSGVNVENVGDIALVGPMVAALIEGMGIALWTTLSGIVLYIVLSLNLKLMEWSHAV